MSNNGNCERSRIRLSLAVAFLALFAIGCKENATSAVTASKQKQLILTAGLHSEASGKAIDSYAKGVTLLKKAGVNRDDLKKLLGDDGAQATRESLELFREAAAHVLEGASKRDPGIPRMAWLQTEITVGTATFDTGDFLLPSTAALVLARHELQKNNYDRSERTAQAVFAMGTHFATSDDQLLATIGLACKQTAIRVLREAALAAGDSAGVKEYDAIRVELDDEFATLRDQKDEPGLIDIVETVLR